MRRVFGSALAVAAIMLVPVTRAHAQDASKSVANGGIMVDGWQGEVDAREAGQGKTVKDAMFMKEGSGFHVTTGPATTYWNPANKASGNYTVKAMFKEPKFMGLNSHAHPYGIVIGGNDMGTDQATYLYCAPYGTGTFIVRGFGPAPFQMNGREGEANAAVHKAAAKGEEVTQEVAMSVKGDEVTCAINGKTVATYKKSDVVGPGKLKSTDGVYGIRMAHNTEAIITGFSMTKN